MEATDAAVVWAVAIHRVAEAIGRKIAASRRDTPTAIHAQALAETYERLFQLEQRGLDRTDELVVPFLEARHRVPLSGQVLADSYERILDLCPTWDHDGYRLRVAERARKRSGSYFTPPDLVRKLVESTLAPVVAARLQNSVFGAPCGFETPLLPIARWSAGQRERGADELLKTRVCDPACGPGGFLISAVEVLSRQLARLRSGCHRVDPTQRRHARQDVLRRCVFGVDCDPHAVAVARLALWITAGRPKVRPETLVPHLRVGDSFDGCAPPLSSAPASTDRAGGIAVAAEKPLFQIRAVDDGFDVVIGNPPFANAIEGLVDADRKQRLSRLFPELGGTADLAYYFVALAHRITRPDGAVGLILPRGVLTSRSTRVLRQRLLEERPPSFIWAPQNQFLFAGANVFVVLLVLRRGANCLGSRDGNVHQPKYKPIRIAGENWWAPLIAGTQAGHVGQTTLGDAFEIFASMTAGMAYALHPYLTDRPADTALRLVTTGLIDAGKCYWGKRKCRYLKRDFRRPFVRLTSAMPRPLFNRLAKVRRPKVLVAGLSNRVEAFFDRQGIYCGAVSTFTVLHRQDSEIALQKVCDYLNGPDATEQLHLQLGAHAMGGGRITLNKDFLRSLPYL
jgi:hypothetical protein